MMKRKTIAGILSVTLTLCLAAWPAAALSAEDQPCSAPLESGSTADFAYTAYRQQYAQAGFPQREIAVPLTQAEGGEATRVRTDGGEERDGWLTREEETVTWPFTVEETGWYRLQICYFTGGGSAVMERGLRIDGEQPFSEAEGLSFFRMWQDAPVTDTVGDHRFAVDRQGNERLPEQTVAADWSTVWVRESSGMVTEPLCFYLTAGEHTLSLTALREDMVIGAMTFGQPEELPSYEAYRQAHADAAEVPSFSFVRQGEDYLRKSHQEIVPINDRTSAATQPASASILYLNTVGGSGWSVNGMWIEWEITVPEDGLYRLALRYRQNFLSGMTANRRLRLDGEVPFAEAETLEFPYHNGWKNKVLGGEDGDWLFYLTAGTTHTLRLECTLGASAPLLQTAQELTSSLNTVYRRMVMYMGSAPDTNRDYKVEEILPEEMAVLAQSRDRLTALSEELIALSGGRGDANVAIDNLCDVLQKMVKDPRDVPSLLTTFRDYIASLSTWIQTQSKQALEIDWLALLGHDDAPPEESAGFFRSLSFGFRSFLSSFVTDYSMMLGEESDETIEVWIASGRDQAQILKELVMNRFSTEYGIGVNLKLVSGQLLLATMAGEGPDVALGQSSADVMNFALRHALQSIEQYDGFETLRQEFSDEAFVPLSWGEQVYALPEQQTYPLLFYRSDVLNELGLPLPSSWQELYTVIGELQKNNLQFGYPTGLYGYATMLYQQGEQLYEPDGAQSRLSGRTAVETFKEWVRLYTNYGIPVEYDASNRFRSGEMPLLIADYTLYNTLSVFAPEIRGQWGFMVLPGVQEAERVNRSSASAVTGCVMIGQSGHKEAAWTFMKWWASADTQARYGSRLEAVLGTSARYAAANNAALRQLSWTASELRVLETQRSWVHGIPEVPGSYYTSRHLDNAFRRVVNYGEDERKTLIEYAQVIDEEIRYKRRELKLS